jgi:hypothetical protein
MTTIASSTPTTAPAGALPCTPAATPPAPTPTEARVLERPDGGVLIRTGRGDDEVDVTQAEDGTISVSVNGEAVWSGSAAEFADVHIHTGRGDDTVRCDVDGLHLSTGRGDDEVVVRGDGADVRTGRGDDKVVVRGDDAKVRTGRGDDRVALFGEGNRAFLGRGDDAGLLVGRGGALRGGAGEDRTIEHPIARLLRA